MSRNQALVDDVIQFAESGGLLRPSAPITGDRLHLVEDFAEACEYAYHRYLTDAEDALNWTDLREHQVSETHAATAGDLGELRDQGYERYDQLWELVHPRIPELYESIVDDVVADLSNCAYSRAVFGAGDRLFDRIWDAYRQGGWPCGWIGAYPEGELVVFRPPDRPGETAE